MIGIEPTVTPYEEIRDFYQEYETVYERRKDIVLETEQQIKNTLLIQLPALVNCKKSKATVCIRHCSIVSMKSKL